MDSTMNPTSGARPRPEGGWELYAWLFMRISGVALLFLALGHWFIMHLMHSVHTIDYDFVAGRYAGWFWRGYDLLMLWLAMLHGTNGMRIVLEDHLKPPWRRRILWIWHIMALGFLGLGTWTIIMFRPTGSLF
jgi:succinate dehydrogenase / fumarate reductase membrane anchor subunit